MKKLLIPVSILSTIPAVLAQQTVWDVKILGVPWYLLLAVIIVGGIVLDIHVYLSHQAAMIKGTKEKRKIHHKIKHHLTHGRTFTEVKHHLLRVGHDRHVVHHEMGKLELYHYIYHNLRRGKNIIQIKRMLVRQGWKQGVVDATIRKAIKRYNAQKSKSSY